jgi:hypothetical protein
LAIAGSFFFVDMPNQLILLSLSMSFNDGMFHATKKMGSMEKSSFLLEIDLIDCPGCSGQMSADNRNPKFCYAHAVWVCYAFKAWF